MQPVPRVPLDRPATYDDLVAVPDHLVAEIIDGELWTSPRPAPRHATAHTSVGTLVVAPYDHGRGGPGGWRILFEPELHLERDVAVPDVAGWRRSRMPRLPQTAYFSLAPDWVCEVVSPSTAVLDRTKKLRVYAREGVGHCWMVDPIARTLEVLRLESGRWTIVAVHAGPEVVRAEPFDGVDLDLSLLWDEARPPVIADPSTPMAEK
jgi:Uma2 family endonuclease